ncbi:ATP-binding cassette transporter abc4 [Termitomyces sp. J132]|nr:ATP-binding cassette transporter abc4 [Termitomyces sp. J132]
MTLDFIVQDGAELGLSISSSAVPWHSEHAISVYISIASAGCLFIHSLFASKYLQRLGWAKSLPDFEVNEGHSHVERHGGRVIFAAEVMTLIGNLELLRVSLLRVFQLGGWQNMDLMFSLITFTYTSLLALFVVLYPRSTTVSRHVSLVLAAAWIPYFIRDVVPCATYTRSPADPLYLLWELIGVLSFTGVLLPLITPRRHAPFDPSYPMPPNPEQTVPLLSLALFSFLDPIVWKAYKAPRTSLSDLPPLADSDHAKHLIHAAFPHLDPLAERTASKKGVRVPSPPRRPIFLAIATVFRKEIVLMGILLLCNITSTLTNPYGLKRLLEYLETKGEGATVKPWVWIASLCLAPFASTLIGQQYQRILTRGTIHLEAILTQLILQHALRIRIVAEGKSEPTTAETSVPAQSQSATAVDATKNLVGRMNNLISADLQAITRGSEFMQVFFFGPFMVLLCVGFLYTILGWSALVGFAVMVAMMPIPVQVTKMLSGAAKEVSTKGDERVEAVTETITVIRMIKMFGWEKKMAKKIDEKRKTELHWVWWNKLYSLLTLVFQFIIPAVTMCVTFSVYALIMKRPLNAATVFSSITLFDLVRSKMYQFFTWLPMVIRAGVSLQRISEFLQTTELLDEFTPSLESRLVVDRPDEIGFRAATFSWSKEVCSFRLNIEDDLLFDRGGFNLIIGPTGCGKTSLIMALLGEMHFIPSSPDSWFNLPRSGGVAYAAQESWVLNTTIKDNVLFGAPFDEQRYNKVIYQCALTSDLELLKAGDLTEVGEKGLTLSGGQKARLTLARAIYSSAEILLLDDVLAALDVHVAKWIVNKCFLGDLVQGRTILLVTHNVAMVGSIATFVVSLGSDGRILSQGSILDTVVKNSALEAELSHKKEIEEKAEESVDGDVQEQKKPKEYNEERGKLVIEEESGKGHLSWGSLKIYLFALGGKHWALFWTVFTVTIVLECVFDVLQPWLLGAWASEYSRRPLEEINTSFYLMGYILLMGLMLALYVGAVAVFTLGALRASESLHRQLVETILSATFRWLDKTPTSRIITRVTQDVSAVDTVIPELFAHMFELFFTITVRFIAILVYTPTVGLFAIVIFVIGGLLGNVYMQSQLSVKRSMSKVKAPVMAHFGASIEGMVSIRAYGAQNAVLTQSLSLVDDYSRASRVFSNFARWIAVRVDALGGFFAAILGIYYVYYNTTGISASNSGFTLALAVGFGRMVLGFVQFLNMFEVNGNSLERLQEYMTIECEPSPQASGVPPAHWPSSGDLRVENLTASYALEGADALHDLSFHVKTGERIGVVGRTGSGKSTLALSLLRCIVTKGDVFYDGLRINNINLDALREKITIIPQVPELLSGTLRRNLDPFDQFEDVTLNAALRDAGLYSLQEEDATSRITLDSVISRGGSNLSVGQRQIIALARAMVRDSKLLILDEADKITADHKTDAVIQASLRTNLNKDATVITVAHRLQTIMDTDRIMVINAGNIVEFDAPHMLLQKEGGFLRTLVDESGDCEALHAMAAQAFKQ